jgi:hypothetical protein
MMHTPKKNPANNSRVS